MLQTVIDKPSHFLRLVQLNVQDDKLNSKNEF